MKVKIKDARLAFPHLWTAESVNGTGDPKFSCVLLLEPDSPSVKAVREAVEAVGKDKWGGKWPAVKKELEAKDRLPLHDGAQKADYDGFAGMLYISASSKMRPLVIDRDRTPLAEADGKPYAGCYVHAIVDVWAQDNQFGKRVNAALAGVQFARDGDAFGGVTASADDFDALEDEDDLSFV